MKDRLIGMMGTCGLILVLAACAAPNHAFADDAQGCERVGCKDGEDNVRDCDGSCKGSVGGTECSCAKRSGSCNCDASSE